MGWFRKYVLHNAGRKLLALGIAISLWAMYAPEPLEIGYDVPIAYGHAPRDFAITGDTPTEVHMLLRGRAALMRRINPADLSFTVDLSHVSAGETQVPLTPEMAGVPYGADVVGLAPTTLHVSFAPPSASAPR